MTSRARKLEAFEFITEAKDGTIQIPKEYQSLLSKELRVLILIESEERSASNKKNTTSEKPTII